MKVPTSIQKQFVFLFSLVEQGQNCTWAQIEKDLSQHGYLRSTASVESVLVPLFEKEYVHSPNNQLMVTDKGMVFLKSVCDTLEEASTAFSLISASGARRVRELQSRLPEVEYAKVSGGIHYHVYVALLADSVQREYEENNPSRITVYVGMTGLDPNKRFRNHKRGNKASSRVKKYGICLMPELYFHLNPMNHDEAVSMEVQFAGELKQKGYVVYGGH